ncbi:hypothetical protein PK35_14340 [Tamlana nanhaiensis]|uniref:Gylcosyl hydrolase 115 C-terminal domain-containing protein n=1 Tax=Neotamlana nanhaiensis TaxID=1382798 RepID=A0A0D7VYQ7_9FLAO|nr:glycosyl hydrolase 115 family protein [Tamlana nanhaiensis]KJD31578.1 hypothetical protein PK35_14340 [Tamlana nanhaiensis]
MKLFHKISLIAFLIISCKSAQDNQLSNSSFEIVTPTTKTSILYGKGERLDSITANLLAEDIYKVTSYKPKVITSTNEATKNVIVIGELKSNLIKTFLEDDAVKQEFKNQWESYIYKTITNPTKTIEKAFIITGTNPRGTAYGVFDLSKKIGVSPWYWWADVPAKKQQELIINQPEFYSSAPSVAFRGIFLNDEDWGLQPWAEHTFEPETGDIGPKTYSKIFELLLRLKANTIWPAMHPSTKAFFHYPSNRKMAEAYNIVIGTSHAEPMLRNNVDEWNKETMGHFNYKTNKESVYKYWEDRVKEAKNIDGIYSMGMRGVHDSGMEGVKSKDEAVEVLTDVIADQRGLLKKYINPNVEDVPQALTVYKEVLDLYKNGLKVPDDITLVWTDDNYGYIRSLSNAEEQKRNGGSGVYYHASYWGRPHDYLWLESTNPYLIHEEMMKAYNLNNKDIWILNVGDIKPAEYSMQLFLDMAFDAESFQKTEAVKAHQTQFFTDIFGADLGETMADIKTAYYQLAFERKPEFMGWSQTEKTTPIYKSAYNTLSYGDEISERIKSFETLENKVDSIEEKLPEALNSSFTQLLSYPVKGASNMTKKFMYRDKALVYANQGRKSASVYKDKSNNSYENIVALTKNYNALSNGKWQGIMDMKPRRLPVFDNPEINLEFKNTEKPIGISVEDTSSTKSGIPKLPTFYVNDTASYFIDVFLVKNNQASWSFENIPNWIKLSQVSGELNDRVLEKRIQVSIDWNLWKASGEPLSAQIKIKSEGFNETIQINTSNSYQNLSEASLVEKNGLAVIYASSFSNIHKTEKTFWEKQTGFGHTQSVMQAKPLNAKSTENTTEAAYLEYDIETETITNEAILKIVAIPTHPLTTDGDVRIKVQWNNEPIQELSFKTYGRSNTWKQNVLTNKAIKQMKVSLKTKGKQTLKIFMVDAGVALDYMVLNTKNKKLGYKLPKETELGR